MDNKKQVKPEPEIVAPDKDNEFEEMKAKYLRILADYQNLERRIEDQRVTIRKDSNTQLLLKLLPFLDNLEKAEVFVKDKGLQMVRDTFAQTLKAEGLEEIEVLGKEFDPYVAEVVDVVEGEKDNMVVEVLRKGYRYNDKILRVAQVRVSKKKS